MGKYFFEGHTPKHVTPLTLHKRKAHGGPAGGRHRRDAHSLRSISADFLGRRGSRIDALKLNSQGGRGGKLGGFLDLKTLGDEDLVALSFPQGARNECWQR